MARLELLERGAGHGPDPSRREFRACAPCLCPDSRCRQTPERTGPQRARLSCTRAGRRRETAQLQRPGTVGGGETGFVRRMPSIDSDQKKNGYNGAMDNGTE